MPTAGRSSNTGTPLSVSDLVARRESDQRRPARRFLCCGRPGRLGYPAQLWTDRRSREAGVLERAKCPAKGWSRALECVWFARCPSSKDSEPCKCVVRSAPAQQPPLKRRTRASNTALIRFDQVRSMWGRSSEGFCHKSGHKSTTGRLRVGPKLSTHLVGAAELEPANPCLEGDIGVSIGSTSCLTFYRLT